ncbi:MAG: HD domain-containing protein [Dehalococcoidia bacterium]|nr:MAG: HD domain-containing protein [Dehalococcoidia bacterium]
MIDEAKVIIVMEEHMKASLPPDKVIVLGIPDIWNSNIDAYKACALEMKQGFQKYWPKIVNESPQLQKASPPPKSKIEEQLEHFNKLIKNSGLDPWPSAPKVCEEVLKIAKSVNYGRGAHSKTVTRLMLNMYDDMVAIDLIKRVNNKRILAEIIGLSHDIGVGKEKPNEEHNEAGWRMLKEQLWECNILGDNEKDPLALIMYGVFYHRDEIIDGKLKPLGDIPLWDSRAAAELVSLVRIADGLDHGYSTGSPDKIVKVEMVRTPKGVECRVFPRSGENVDSFIAKSYSKREVFEATFGKLTYWLPGGGGGWVPWNPND